MPISIYLPTDSFGGTSPNDLDLAADFLELSAIFSLEKCALTQLLGEALRLNSNGEYSSVGGEITEQEDIESGAALMISKRKKALGSAYPFEISGDGRLVLYDATQRSYGQAAYVISLVLSNLSPFTPMLDNSGLHPSNSDVTFLRECFQYFATAALAAEIGGQAWSFGFPRPDGTGFLPKLKEIWVVLKDGIVDPEVGEVPDKPKDDGIDVFACRPHADGLPGFLFAAAQVATGKNWQEKPLRGHLNSVFFGRWFSREPVTLPLSYHIVPFALPETGFRGHVRSLGNVLHRLRLPLRVEEAERLHKQGVPIEAYDQLEKAVEWVNQYASRELDQ